jgi:hypothetical protein
MPLPAHTARRHARAGLVLATAVAAGASGCAALPAEPDRAAPESVRGGLQRSTGIRLAEARPPAFSGNLPNVEATYFGGDERASLLVLVFDSPKATAQPLGRGFRIPPGTVLIRRRNVVVLYTRRAGEPDRAPAIGRAVGDA